MEQWNLCLSYPHEERLHQTSCLWDYIKTECSVLKTEKSMVFVVYIPHSMKLNYMFKIYIHHSQSSEIIAFYKIVFAKL